MRTDPPTADTIRSDRLPLNVMISGFTAAGKTANASIVSQRHQLELVAASSIMLSSILGDGVDIPGDFWISEEGKAARTSRSSLLELDHYLIKASLHKTDAVFDTWGLPWLSPAPAFRIWIDSSPESRAKKAALSHHISREVWNHVYDSIARNEPIDLPPSFCESDVPCDIDNLLPEVLRKDLDAYMYFVREFGVDMGRYHNLFDLVIDATELISDTTLESSIKSIRAVDSILDGAIRWLMDPGVESVSQFQKVRDLLPAGVVKRCPLALL